MMENNRGGAPLIYWIATQRCKTQAFFHLTAISPIIRLVRSTVKNQTLDHKNYVGTYTIASEASGK